MDLGQGHWPRPTVRDIHCESVATVDQAAGEKKKSGTKEWRASVGDFSRKSKAVEGGDGSRNSRVEGRNRGET
jgi:hypothetical protein